MYFLASRSRRLVPSEYLSLSGRPLLLRAFEGDGRVAQLSFLGTCGILRVLKCEISGRSCLLFVLAFYGLHLGPTSEHLVWTSLIPKPLHTLYLRCTRCAAVRADHVLPQ